MTYTFFRSIVRSRRFWIAVVCFVLIGGGVYVMNLPSRGTVSLITSRTNGQNEDRSAWNDAREKTVQQILFSEKKSAGAIGWSVYRGKYISFDYPNTFTIQPNNASSSASLEKAILLGTGTYAEKIVVTATRMPETNTLDEVSAIQMRRINTAKYTESSASAATSPGIRFDKKKDGYEAVIFFLQNKILYVLTLTASAKDPKLDALFDTLLASFTLN